MWTSIKPLVIGFLGALVAGLILLGGWTAWQDHQFLNAIRAAQAEFGTAEIDATQLRWGLEHINLTAERLEELGATGMVAPFSTSCANHTGHAGGWMLQWDGEKFVQASDHLTPDLSVINPLIESAAAEYAAANAPWPVNEACEG